MVVAVDMDKQWSCWCIGGVIGVLEPGSNPFLQHNQRNAHMQCPKLGVKQSVLMQDSFIRDSFIRDSFTEDALLSAWD